MARWADDTEVLDAQLGILAAATLLVICAGQPTTYNDATATKDLAQHVLTPAIGGGDFSAGNGDSSGRKLTLAAQNGITVDHSGNADHYALCISATSKLLWVGVITLQAVVSGNTINFPATDVDEIGDPTA
jgi:hypothetical protein